MMIVMRRRNAIVWWGWRHDISLGCDRSSSPSRRVSMRWWRRVVSSRVMMVVVMMMR
jgi:hypothetical protein